MNKAAKYPKAFTSPPALRVRSYDSPLRFLVESESEQAKPHLVDLENYAGNGECSCKHFVCRLAPELKMGRAPGNATRCKHIQAARAVFTDYAVRVIARRHNNNNERNDSE